MHKTCIDIRPESYWLLCVCLLLLPFKLVFAWLISVAVHEVFHYAALMLCGCSVPYVQIGAFGAKMDTGPLTPGKEIICAAAGPLGGVFLLLFINVAPLISVFGILHTVYNLIPVFPLDGGRVMHCLIRILAGTYTGSRIASILEYAVIAVLLVLATYGFVKFFLGPVPLICVIALMWKNRTAKCSCKP